ncbi:hypothetical protein DRJ48_02100 [Candidatus Woesearchaeota archaeon]|nr:MAG: hypothetical protein DRJ48_02100 [Candidatus Woesearchaeota archaeon]
MQATNFIVNRAALGVPQLESLLEHLVAQANKRQPKNKQSKILYTELTRDGEVKIPRFKPDGKNIGILGGDGTVNSVVDTVKRQYEAESSECPPFLFVLCGTGNGIKIPLGLHATPEDTLMAYSKDEMRPKPIDLVELIEPDRRYFVNMFDAGIVADVLKTRNKMLKVSPEPLTRKEWYSRDVLYPLAALVEMLKDPRYAFTRIELDGRVVSKEHAKLVTLANGLCYSSRNTCYPAPHAKIDDGLLSTAIYKLKGRMDITKAAIMIRRGKPTSLAHYAHCTEALIEGKQLPCQIDGEYLGKLDRVAMVIKNKGISVYVP